MTMDPRIEILKKNYEERMNEFVNILSRADCLPGAKVLDEWRFHLELSLKNSGWVAIYKPSKKKQPSPGPDFVNELVMVEKVEYHNFEAAVTAMEQNESIANSEASSLAAKIFSVPLEDLFPCVEQPNAELDGVEINNILDKLRFFKQNLWLPWDEDDDSEDWRVSALEPRMQLLYDMEQEQVSCEIAEQVRRLFGQAWHAHDALRALELAIDEEGDTTSQSSHESQAQEEEEGLVIRIMQLHLRIDNIQKELERLQNPLIRNLMVREKQIALKRVRKPEMPWIRLVWSGGDLGQLSACLAEATSIYNSKERFKVYPRLQMALEEASAGDVVTLSPGHYTLLGSGGLEEGGTIQGLGEKKVFLSGCESGDVMLSLRCEPVHKTQQNIPPGFALNNLTLDASNLEICLLLNSGHILLENCEVDGSGSHTADSVGAMIREGAKLTARNCTFSGFHCGLVAYEGAQIELVDCAIKNCVTGMQLFRGVQLEMERCIVSECSTSGVMYKWKSQEHDKEDKVVARELLNSLPGLKVHSTDFQEVQIVVQRSDSDNTDFMAAPA